MADRIFINRNYKDYIDLWSGEKNILDFKAIENIEKFTLAAALGINSPSNINGAREGYIRYSYIQTNNKSLLSSILLGRATTDEIDTFSNEEICYTEAEKCAETGFMILKDRIDDSKGDEDLLYRRLMVEIDRLYETNVKPYIEEANN